MAQAVTTVSGRAVPVRGNDIDTDRIIPARFLRCVTFDGLGEHAFADDRAQLAGRGEQHPFDTPAYAGATILVVNTNFGCGSSREHAPQALAKWGIQAIIGVSFAEIFFGNNVAMGIPCLTVSREDADTLQDAISAKPQLAVNIDVATGIITCGDLTITGNLPAGPQRMFTTGQWDATGQLLEGKDEVAATAATLPYVSQFA